MLVTATPEGSSCLPASAALAVRRGDATALEALLGGGELRFMI